MDDLPANRYFLEKLEFVVRVTEQNYKQYRSIENKDDLIVLYPDLFTLPEILYNLDKLVHLPGFYKVTEALTGQYFSPLYETDRTVMVIFSVKYKMKIVYNKAKFTLPCEPGTVLFIGKQFHKNATFSLPKKGVYVLYELGTLYKTFLSTKRRLEYAKKIRKDLQFIEQLPEWSQCVQQLIPLTLVGKGSYGNVYKTEWNNRDFAIKISKVKEEAVAKPFSTDYISWHEVYILANILYPLIERKICPNFPILYNVFTCSNCELILEKKKTLTPGVITSVELANGDLKEYLQIKRTIPELHTALFQICAAIHAIQKYGQIQNFDVKKENVLVYLTEPGGYWEYTIRNKTYYVPNHGALFILNDFGVSRSLSPEHLLSKNETEDYRLGHRLAVVNGAELIPLHIVDYYGTKIDWTVGKKTYSTNGVEFHLTREKEFIPKVTFDSDSKEVLRYLNLPTETEKDLFMHPEIFPPMEFYNDTQDALRMFIGGKRTTQKGTHSIPKGVPKELAKQLKPYIGVSESVKNHKFSIKSAQVLAGCFIEEFFVHMTVRPGEEKGPMIERFVME